MRRSIKLFLVIVLSASTMSYGRPKMDTAHTKLPQPLLGLWYTQNGGQLKFGLFDRGVVYNNTFWHYKSVRQNHNKVILKLTNASHKKRHLKIKIKHSKDSYTFQIPGSKTIICQKKRSKCFIHHDLPRFNSFEFQKDSVYVHYFLVDPHGEKVSIKENQLLTGITTNHFTAVDKDGFAHFSIAVTNPVLLQLKLPHSNQPEKIYMLPGESILLIQTSPTTLHYGDNGAQLAQEIQQLIQNTPDHHSDPLTALPSENLSNQILSPADYKSFMVAFKEHLQHHLDHLYKLKQISPLAYQIGNYQIQYSIAAALLHYHDYTKQSANATIVRRYEQPPLPNSYYDFLKSLDNDSAFIAPAYFDFIQSFRDQNSAADLPDIGHKGVQPDTSATIDELGNLLLPLENLHPPLDEQQKTFLNNFQQIASPTEKENYSKQYKAQIKELYEQYKSIIQFKKRSTYIQEQCKLKLGWNAGVTTDLINYANLTLQLFNKNQISLPADYFVGPNTVYHTPFIGNYLKEYTTQAEDDNEIIIKINKNTGKN